MRRSRSGDAEGRYDLTAMTREERASRFAGVLKVNRKCETCLMRLQPSGFSVMLRLGFHRDHRYQHRTKRRFKAGHLIDKRWRPMSPPWCVSKKVAWSPLPQVCRCRLARIIDPGSATLLPGFIDLHTHLTDRQGIHWEEVGRSTPAEAALWFQNARITLEAGFMTCREMARPAAIDVALRNAIDEGAVPGPRLMVSGNYVSSTGGAGDARQFSTYVDVPMVRNLADGPDEVLKAVRTNFKNGADFIKILATGAVLSRGIEPGAQQYSDEEIGAAVTEATRWGRQVAAHAHGTGGIKTAIRAGVRTIDHGTMLDAEAVEFLKKSVGRTHACRRCSRVNTSRTRRSPA